MNHHYGEKPPLIATIENDCKELMFYQDMPIKFPHGSIKMENRIRDNFDKIIDVIICDFIKAFGKREFEENYIYVSAKHLFQPKSQSFNRFGYHCDGFMTDDINYIWSDANPTILNIGEFNLSMNDKLSIQEMNEQARPENEFSYPDNSIVRLNQFNVHKVNEDIQGGLRTFLKVSFSRDRYNKEGNAHNYSMDYNWFMTPRSAERNIPQTEIKK